MGMQQDETGHDGEEGTVECYHVGDHNGRDAVSVVYRHSDGTTEHLVELSAGESVQLARDLRSSAKWPTPGFIEILCVLGALAFVAYTRPTASIPNAIGTGAVVLVGAAFLFVRAR